VTNSKSIAPQLIALIVVCVAAYYFATVVAPGATGKSLQAMLAQPASAAIVPHVDDTAFAVQGKPSVSAQFINKVLCAPVPTDTPAVSPACGTGQAMFDLGVKYGIDPVYALAFFWHESTLGRYGVAVANLGLGNIKCTPGYVCKQGFRAYSSWEEGYADWYKLITAYIAGQIKGCPCKTVPEIVPVYAPPSENDTPGYTHKITQMVTTWRQEATA